MSVTDARQEGGRGFTPSCGSCRYFDSAAREFDEGACSARPPVPLVRMTQIDRSENPETGEITYSGKQSYCGRGDAEAVGCLYRMKTSPPNHLDSASCQPIPEWSEAIDLLRQNGLLDPDEYGRWKGEDFAFKIERVWWALVHLLVETGHIERVMVEGIEDMQDSGEQSRLAKALLFPPGANHA